MKTVKEIADLIKGKVLGHPEITISGITNAENPRSGHITFAQDQKNLSKLETTEISCIIAPPQLASEKKTLIHAEHPKIAWAKLLEVFYPPKTHSGQISKNAFIAPSARIGQEVTIEAFAAIGERTVIEDGAVISSQVSVGSNVRIGKKTILHPNVTVYDHCQIGASVIMHAGCVIGADGFGYVHTPERQEKVPQVGNVVIEDEVELGACVTIDCATVGSTQIGKGCKIDNLVQVGHNVSIAPHTVISAQTGISGSCKIGSHVTMGGKVGLGDHVEIGDWTMVGAGAGFATGKRVPPKQIVFGQPARPYHEARKQIAAQLRSAETLEEVKTLKKKVRELEERLAAQKNA